MSSKFLLYYVPYMTKPFDTSNEMMEIFRNKLTGEWDMVWETWCLFAPIWVCAVVVVQNIVIGMNLSDECMDLWDECYRKLIIRICDYIASPTKDVCSVSCFSAYITVVNWRAGCQRWICRKRVSYDRTTTGIPISTLVQRMYSESHVPSPL